MIYLIHGENTVAIREKLLELKREYAKENVYHLESSAEIFELTNFVRGGSLFGKRFIILEDPKLAADQVHTLEKDISSFQADICFIFSERLPKTHLVSKFVSKAGGRVFFFDETAPKTVFPFLDALTQKNRDKALRELQILISRGEDAHFILSMIAWQFRSLAKVKAGSLEGVHPYVASKLRSASRGFTEDEVAAVYRDVLKADNDLKKGRFFESHLFFLVEKITR